MEFQIKLSIDNSNACFFEALIEGTNIVGEVGKGLELSKGSGKGRTFFGKQETENALKEKRYQAAMCIERYTRNLLKDLCYMLSE